MCYIGGVLILIFLICLLVPVIIYFYYRLTVLLAVNKAIITDNLGLDEMGDQVSYLKCIQLSLR